MVMHAAEKLPQESPKIEGEGQDVEQLVADLEQHEADKNVAALVAVLEKLGDELKKDPQNSANVVAREMMDKSETSLAAELHIELLKMVEKEVDDEVQYLTENRGTMQTADEMVDMVIDLALERGGAPRHVDTDVIAMITADKELRAFTKEKLAEAVKAKMADSSLGNDSEKVSKLEKALDELEK